MTEKATLDDTLNGQPLQSACSLDNGNWYCLTCDHLLPGNFYKDIHIDSGDHRLAWMCIEHGPEVP